MCNVCGPERALGQRFGSPVKDEAVDNEGVNVKTQY